MFLSPLLKKVVNALPKRSNKRNVIEPLAFKALELIKKNFSAPKNAQGSVNQDEYPCADYVKDQLGPEKWSELVSNIMEVFLVSCETVGNSSIQVAETSFLAIKLMFDEGYVEGRIATEKIINRIIACLKGSYLENQEILYNLLSLYETICLKRSFQVHGSFYLKIILSVLSIASSQSNSNQIENISKDKLYSIARSKFDVNIGDTPPPQSYDVQLVLKERSEIFLLLCKLCVKDREKKYSERTRILALKILFYLLSDNVEHLQSSSSFVEFNIKTHMLQALFICATCDNFSIFRLTTCIFTLLIKNFSSKLEAHIECILYYVHLLLLTSNSTSKVFAIQLVQSLLELFNIPNLMLNFYIKYDLNASSYNVFDYLVETLSTLAQKKLPFISDDFSDTSYYHEYCLKEHALDSCITIFSSLSHWVDRHDEAKISSHTLSREYQETCRQKQLIEQAKIAFNKSASKGLLALLDSSLISSEPQEAAAFLFYVPGLSRVQIGELISSTGSVGPIPINAILIEYIKLIPLSWEIDLALKSFLYTLEIPKEGQKVERLLMGFGSVYYNTYPDCGVNSANAAFFLASSILMYLTSVHNPAVSSMDKIGRDDWKRLMVGENSGKDFDSSMLDRIARRIEDSEFPIRDEFIYSPGMTDVDKKRSTNKFQDLLKKATFDFLQVKNLLQEDPEQLCVSDPESKYSSSNRLGNLNEKYSNISAIISAFDESQEEKSMLDEGVKKRTSTFAAQNYKIFSVPKANDFQQLCEYAYSMFVLVSNTLRNSFVSSFEVFPEKCFDGLLLGFHLCCVYGESEEAKKYLQLIIENSSVSDIDVSKTIIGIQKFLRIAEEEQAVNENWSIILKFTSELHHYANNIFLIKSENIGALDERLILYLKTIDFDRIYTASSKLKDSEFVMFIKAICKTSLIEFEISSSFSLQKLVETLTFNITRPPNVLVEIWNEITEYSVKVSLMDIDEQAWILIDSLRQMTEKMLLQYRGNLVEFQAVLLQPFESIYDNFNVKIREYIMSCVSIIISTHNSSIKSGWHQVFSLFYKVSQNINNALVAELVLTQIEKCLKEFVDQIYSYHAFLRLIEITVCFVKNSSTQKLNFKVLDLMIECSNAISKLFESKSKKSNDEEFSTCWTQIFDGFTHSIKHHDVNVRSVAIGYFFDMLAKHKSQYSLDFQKHIFYDVLFKVLQDKVFSFMESNSAFEDPEWVVTACLKYSQNIFLLFGHFYDTLSPLLPDLISLLERMILQDNEKLATSGIACLETLIAVLSNKASDQKWELIIKIVQLIFTQNLNCFFTADENSSIDTSNSSVDQSNNGVQSTAKVDGKLNFNKKTVLGKLWIQYQVIKIVWENIFVQFFSYTEQRIIGIEQIFFLTRLYSKCFKKSRKLLLHLNSNIPFDEQLFESLLKLNSDSMQFYIKVLSKLVEQVSGFSQHLVDIQDLIFEALELLIVKLPKSSLQKTKSTPFVLKDLNNINEKFTLAVMILVLSMKDLEIEFLKRLYPLMTSLCHTDNAEIRQKLSEYLVKTGVLGLAIPQESFELPTIQMQ